MALKMHVNLINEQRYTFAVTHWGRKTHICVTKLTSIGSDNGLPPSWTAPSHYLNQCWNIVNWSLRNKLQWKFNRNSNIFIHENAIESVVCEMAAIFSQPQCVNGWPLPVTYRHDDVYKIKSHWKWLSQQMLLSPREYGLHPVDETFKIRLIYPYSHLCPKKDDVEILMLGKFTLR